MTLTIDVDRVGDLISSIGSPAFGAQYFDLFAAGLGIDQCTVFAFRGSQRPDPLVLEGKSQQMRQIAHDLAMEYMAGAFTRDPNVQLGQKLQSPTVHCLRADQLLDRNYRVRFYDRPCLAHELVVLGQAEDVLYYSSFYRSDRRAAFKSSELERVTGMASLALKALRRHLQLLGGVGLQSWKSASAGNTTGADRRQETAAHLRDVLLAEPYALSQREAQVCAGIILGYTTLGISLNFGISMNTVATHRKRAYRKLKVSSQNELFSRYFQVVNHRTGAPSNNLPASASPAREVIERLAAETAFERPSTV